MLGAKVGRLLVVLVAGCGSSSNTPPHDAAVDTPDAAILRTVSGTFNLHLISAAGESTQAVNLTGAPIAALTMPSFTSLSATTTTNGTFTIDGVPTGTYYLQFGTRYFVLSADTVDLTFDVLGRANAGFATNPTNLTFNVSGLASWQANDELALFSPQTGTAAYALQAVASAGAPMPNDTTLTGLVYDLSLADRRALIDTTAGDQAFLTQLSTQSDGTRSYRVVAQSFSPSPLTLTNGTPTTITGAFTAVPTSGTLTAVWDRPAFAAEIAAHAPRFVSQNFSTFALTALPQASTLGHYSEGPDIVVYAPGYSNDSTTLNASWAYGDPYPASWTRLVFLRYYQYRYIQLPGASRTAIYSRMLAHRDLATISAATPIEPIVGVPISPKVNGLDASGTTLIPNVGVSPTLSWDPPALGTATRYYVSVYQLKIQSGATVTSSVALIDTSETKLVIPPSVLMSGQTYVFEIEARCTTGIDLAARPDAYSLPEGYASVTTTMVTP